MVVALLVVGSLAMPVTGLFIRPDVRWARHGTQMFVGAATVLLRLTLILGAIHVLFVAKGFGGSASDDRPWLAAVSAAIVVAASLALVFARTRLRRAPAQ